MKTQTILISFALLSFAASAPAAASVGNAFTYQGKLMTAAGNPTTGLYDMKFTLYDTNFTGTAVAGPITNSAVGVTNGYFAVMLDFGAAFNGIARWLEIEVRTNGAVSFSTLYPRQAITPAPYAVYAPSAGAAATATTASTATLATTATTATTANSVAAANVTGTLSTTQLPAAVVTNNATAVTLSGWFTGNGTGLTGVNADQVDGQHGAFYQNAANLTSGTLADARLSANVPQLSSNQVFLASNRFAGVVTLTNTANTLAGAFIGNGSGITNLNASQLSSGAVPLALLPGAVVTNNETGLNLSGTFSGNGAGVTNVSLLTVNSIGALSWITNYPAAFTLTGSPGAGTGPSSVVAADVNGDGKIDLVCANRYDYRIEVSTNLGNGTFAPPYAASVGPGYMPSGITAADVDHDGDMDVIASTYYDSALAVLINNGSGGFGVASRPPVGANPYLHTAADVNGDGYADLVCANYGSNSVTVLTNNRSGGFAVAATVGVGSQPLWATAADVNGDGYMDVISANNGASTLTILTNNHSGQWIHASTPPVGNSPRCVIAADVNNDGHLDLITANEMGTTLTVLTNNGNGSFTFASSPPVGDAPFAVIAADLNTDGSIDLVSADSNSDSLTVLTNNGNGGFVRAALLSVGNGPNSVTAADFNNDGHQDLASANEYSNTLSVFLNTPSYKTGFQGNFIGSGVGLTNLNATSLTGTIADTRLTSNVSLLNTNQVFTASNRFTGIVILTNGANTIAGNGAGLTNLNASQFSSGILPLGQLPPEVVTNNATNVTLAGTFSGNAGALTNLNATNLIGTVTDARLSANVALLNTNQAFSGSNRFAGVIIATNAANMLAGTFAGSITGTFAGNGAGVTNLNASQIAAGTLPLGQLPLQAVTNNESSVTLSGTFSGNGAGLTNLSAAYLTGTIADGRLSANVALRNAMNIFTTTNVFSRIGIGATNPAQLLQIGDANVNGSKGMIRLASRTSTGLAGENRIWDIGVPETASDTTGVGYSFIIDDTQLGTAPEFVIRWGTGNVGIGKTNPATTLDVNGTVTATNFAGNAAGLYNQVCSANYLYSYSTITQTVAVAGTFKDITNNIDAAINGWTHTLNTATFTNAQTGLYLITYNAEAMTTTTASSIVSLRATLNGTEISGSATAANANTANLVVSVSKTFLINITSGAVLRFQFTGSSTNDRLVSNAGAASTRPSFSCTVTRLQ